MAYEFSPPTYNQPWIRDHPTHGLLRFYDGFPVGYSVLINSGVASTHPGVSTPSLDDINDADDGSGTGGKAAFLGGHIWTVTAAEKTILETAGYSVDTV